MQIPVFCTQTYVSIFYVKGEADDFLRLFAIGALGATLAARERVLTVGGSINFKPCFGGLLGS